MKNIKLQNRLKAQRKDWRNMICTTCESNTIENILNIAFTYDNCECEECSSIPEYLK